MGFLAFLPMLLTLLNHFGLQPLCMPATLLPRRPVSFLKINPVPIVRNATSQSTGFKQVAEQNLVNIEDAQTLGPALVVLRGANHTQESIESHGLLVDVVGSPREQAIQQHSLVIPLARLCKLTEVKARSVEASVPRGSPDQKLVRMIS